MVLTFQVRFHTNFGQSIALTGNHELFGNGDLKHAVPLQYVDEEFWRATVVIPDSTLPDAEIVYNYVLRNPDESVVYDWGEDKRINPAQAGVQELLIVDSWNHAGFPENAFYTEPFKAVLLKHEPAPVKAASPRRVTHVFKAKAPLLSAGQTLCLIGAGRSLGNWKTTTPVLMGRAAGEDFFSAQLDLSGETFPLAYKYGVWDVAKNEWVRIEGGADRVLKDTPVPKQRTIVNDGFARLPGTDWHGAGVAIPVFSLRSEGSFGVGEFTDLHLLADWARQVGLKLIQILPVNDTTAAHTWMDSYPYAAISAFALHPIYLNLGRVAGKKHAALLKQFEPVRRRLNSLGALDYEAVLNAKLSILREIYQSDGTRTFKSREYQVFLEQNRDWLAPYAVFCGLRDRYGTADFSRWPAHRECGAEELTELSARGSPYAEEIGLHYFTQYHLHLQLREATEYAHSQGVILKGDLPIGISRFSADAWQQPGLYHMDVQAGAPPDAFAVKGQNWGFPTYNWPRMREDGFLWWKRRFRQMACYFDAFRIDHILGFFRIWSIPMDAVEGILGNFVPALPVEIKEFEARGIAFDRARYTQPHITDQLVLEVFGAEHRRVVGEFLVRGHDGKLALKPAFATQRQVEKHFCALPDNEANRRIKQGLFDLISNVILLEVEGARGRELHFRLGMEQTGSFRQLDPGTQAKLRELYVDYFYRRQDLFWEREALQKLPTLKRVTNMLVCGEDLGMVPACVPDVMKQLGLLSLEIQRMPKDPAKEFSSPKDAPYLSVVTPSTHDMSTIRGWWTEDAKRTQKFFNDELHQAGEAPGDCPPWLNHAIVKQHLESPAMWSIFQLQDLLGSDGELRRENPDDERINQPADPQHYWRYRMHLTLEKLLAASSFNSKLRNDLRESGRI